MSINQYLTYAQADADLPNRTAGDIVLVAHDETHGNKYTPYVVQGGALVFDAENFTGFSEFKESDSAKILAAIDIPPTEDPNENDKSTPYTVLGLTESVFESPPGSDNDEYATISAFFGFNLSASGVPDETGKSGFGHFFEQYYIQENVEADEFQLRHYTNEGTQRRYFQTFMPRLDDDKALSASQFWGNRFRITDTSDNLVVNWTMDNGKLEMNRGAYFSFTTNNVPILKQWGTSQGVELTLPYINAREELSIGLPVHHDASPKQNESTHQSYVYTRLRNPVAGAYHRETFLHSAVTGSFIESYFQGSASANILTQVVNSHATGGIFRQLVSTAGNVGDMMQVGSVQWAIGHRASDSTFRISPTGFLGTGDAVVLDKNSKQATFGGPVRVASYTTSGLPTASSAGAGALVWVSDASGGATLAVSNGSNWKVVTLGANVT